jgi:hypothetical protein
MNISFIQDFEQVLPTIEKAINEADFIAFDCEFTGLGDSGLYGYYDTSQMIYSKYRNVSYIRDEINNLQYILFRVLIVLF